jgi:hypothetical protein
MTTVQLLPQIGQMGVQVRFLFSFISGKVLVSHLYTHLQILTGFF